MRARGEIFQCPECKLWFVCAGPTEEEERAPHWVSHDGLMAPYNCVVCHCFDNPVTLRLEQKQELAVHLL